MKKKLNFTLDCLPSISYIMFSSMFLHLLHVQVQNLTTFQEFIMTLMKLKLDAPHQHLLYRLNVSLSTVSMIFFSLDGSARCTTGPTNQLARS